MAYKVFLSHSTRDQGLVTSLANLFAKFGVKVFVAEWYLPPGHALNKKIFGEIDSSDCVVTLLTRNGVRSNWVQQEVGYALKAGKLVVPLVEKGTGQDELAALHDKVYIEYDPSHPHEALTRITTYVASLKLGKDERTKTSLVALGFIALLYMLSGGEK